jgi:hypothetical protein
VLLWRAWKAYAQRAGSYQTRTLLTLVYLIVLGPFASLGRLFGARLLDLKSTSSASSWMVRATPSKTLESLRRQF